MIEQIIEHIREHELNKPSRAREYVYRRSFLCYLLKKQGLTLQKIADIMDRNHATVMHAIVVHKDFMAHSDKIYQSYIKMEMELFEPVIEVKRNIYDDILRVNNTTDLAIIKRRIADNEYY
jgi:hypothetical protein